LGSTGKKPDSGDLDLAVALTDTTKPQLKARLDQFVSAQGQDPRDFVRLTGEAVHFKTPINGSANNGFVQTDFMFTPNVDWGAFFLSGGLNSAYKGMYRNVLLSSIGKAMGFKVSAKGVTSRTTDNVITMDPDRAAEILLGPGNTRKNLQNVESIYQALANNPDKEALVADFRQYLERDNLQEPQSAVAENDVGFLARLRDRIVNQGYVALVENNTITEAEEITSAVEDVLSDGKLSAADSEAVMDALNADGEESSASTAHFFCSSFQDASSSRALRASSALRNLTLPFFLPLRLRLG
jgi:hypothetical protein